MAMEREKQIKSIPSTREKQSREKLSREKSLLSQKQRQVFTDIRNDPTASNNHSQVYDHNFLADLRLPEVQKAGRLNNLPGSKRAIAIIEKQRQ